MPEEQPPVLVRVPLIAVLVAVLFDVLETFSFRKESWPIIPDSIMLETGKTSLLETGFIGGAGPINHSVYRAIILPVYRWVKRSTKPIRQSGG